MGSPGADRPGRRGGAPRADAEQSKEKRSKIAIKTEKSKSEIDFESEKDEYSASESEGYSAKYVTQSQDGRHSKKAEIFIDNKENVSRNNFKVNEILGDFIKIPDGFQSQTSDSSQCAPPQRDQSVKSRTGSSNSQCLIPSSNVQPGRELSTNRVKVVIILHSVGLILYDVI